MADQSQVYIIPPPPRPPREYSYDYGNQLNRWFNNLTELLNGIHYGRFNGLFLPIPNFPVTGYGLKPGEVFANAGILTVVREGDVWIGSLSITVSDGSVTVT